MVEQHRLQLRLVLAERRERLLGHLLERRVGGREDRVRPRSGERLGQARLLDERDQRGEVAGRDGGLDEVGLGCRGGGGACAGRRGRKRQGGESGDERGGAAARGGGGAHGAPLVRWTDKH